MSSNSMACSSCSGTGVMTVTVIQDGQSSTVQEDCWNCDGTGTR